MNNTAFRQSWRSVCQLEILQLRVGNKKSIKKYFIRSILCMENVLHLMGIRSRAVNVFIGTRWTLFIALLSSEQNEVDCVLITTTH